MICESGTGSGSLSHAIALTVAPSGHLYTHDIDETRTSKVQEEFQVRTKHKYFVEAVPKQKVTCLEIR